MSSKVSNLATNLIVFSHPGASKINEVHRLPSGKVIYRKKGFDSGYKKMGPPKQESINLLQNVVCKVTKLRDLFLDACCGQIATGLACLSMQQHGRSVGCERDHNCLAEVMPSLVEGFACQLLNDSDFDSIRCRFDRGKEHSQRFL